MNKALTYSGFAISSLLMVVIFVTAKTYTQLIIAVVLYPLLAYFALKVLPRKTPNAPAVTIQIPPRSVDKTRQAESPKVEVADIEKRTFLKLVGAAGVSFLFFSLLGRRLETLLFSSSLQPGIGIPQSSPDSQAGVSPTEGYKISEIEDNVVSYYGFTNKDGAWLVMREDTETSSFRYAKGDSNFSNNWKNREKLKYDYFYKLY